MRIKLYYTLHNSWTLNTQLLCNFKNSSSQIDCQLKPTTFSDMNTFILAISLAHAANVKVYNNGILLEQKGKLYISNGNYVYDIHMHRPLPFNQFQN